MQTKELLDRLLSFIQDLTVFYTELSEEQPNLRIVVDNTRGNSELKKIPRKYFTFLAQRRNTTEKLYNNKPNPRKRTAAELTPLRLSKKTFAAI